MAFWNNKQESPEPEAPAPAAPTPPVDDRLDKLTSAVAQLAESQLRQAQPQAPAQPQAQPIYDLSDDEYNEVYARGDYSEIQRAEAIRRNAMAERLRREMGGQLAVGLGAVNDLTAKTFLGQNEFYRTDPTFKRGVDSLVQQVKASGALLNDDTLKWIVDKVTGENFDRLMELRQERTTRAKREQGDSGPGGKNVDRRHLPPDLQENYGLSPEAMTSLSHLDQGRGRTPDDYAQRLPKRKVRVMDVDANGKFRERVETRGYANFGDTLKTREWAEAELERQRGIMMGEISPLTPVTPRK